MLVFALLAAGTAILFRLPVHGARPAPFQGFIEPEAVPVVSLTGGKIAQVLAHRGELVQQGQLLLRLDSSELDSHLARVHSALRILPDRLVDAATSLFERLPPQTVARLIQTDPERIAAEQEYFQALVESERNPSKACQARLKRAGEQRKRAYRRAGELRPSRLSALRNLQGEGLETLHWLEAQRERFEVRAPAGGVIEMLNLQPGDVVPPLSRLALVDVQGRFVVEARVPERREKDAVPGRRIEIVLPAGGRVPGVVDSFEDRRIRARVVNPPIVPRPGDSVQVFF